MKLTEIHPNISSLTVVIDGVKYYKQIDILKKYNKNIKEDYEVDFEGRVSFDVDVRTGRASTCTNVGKFKFTTGSGFWEECFREQVPTIRQLCKKAVRRSKMYNTLLR